jgi:hypothetical protein
MTAVARPAVGPPRAEQLTPVPRMRLFGPWKWRKTVEAASGPASQPNGIAPQAAPVAAACIDVRVKFMGDLPTVVGARSIQLALPVDHTVKDLLAYLSATYGEPFTSRVFSKSGRLNHYILIFVDGVKIQGPAGFDQTLGKGEVDVVMLPMFGGG